MNTSNATQLAQADRELWKGLLGAVVLFALLVAGVVMTSPNAAEARGWGHNRHGHHDPEQMRERIAWGAEWILALVDADSAQQEQADSFIQPCLADPYRHSQYAENEQDSIVHEGLGDFIWGQDAETEHEDRHQSDGASNRQCLGSP